eukprot:2903700-Rhodomonas_salina.2
MRCPVLTWAMLLPGCASISLRIGRQYAIGLRACYAVPGTDLGYAATRLPATFRSAYRPSEAAKGIVLRTCYAMSGSDLAYGTICLCARYAMSGTGQVYGAICLSSYALAMPGTDVASSVISPRSASVCCYAMCGTNLAHAAVRCPVLTSRMLRLGAITVVVPKKRAQAAPAQVPCCLPRETTLYLESE